MFGKAKCKLCGDSVRFVLKHLRDKHPVVYENEIKKRTTMQQMIKTYFIE
jgi:hypothetical protein